MADPDHQKHEINRNRIFMIDLTTLHDIIAMIPSQISYTPAALILLIALFGFSQTTVGWVIPATNNHGSDIASTTQRHLHAAVTSPLGRPPVPLISHGEQDFSSTMPSDMSNRQLLSCTYSSHQSTTDEHSNQGSSSEQLSKLCQLLNASPVDLLRFDSAAPDGVRGVYLNQPVQQNDVLLKLPLEACLTDRNPPKWLSSNQEQWATRLAASWLDLSLQQHHEEKAIADGHALWLSLLPDPQFLRASLPVHWSEEVVANARSTSLEVAVDSAYFVRAEAVQALVESLEASPYAKNLNRDDRTALAQRALDVVQTRSCRLEMEDDDEHLRVLAPVYDFINHGLQSRNDEEKNRDNRQDGNANAAFAKEGDYLVVRALFDMNQDEEVLIDYGDGARPAWKCLLSYGFVPLYDSAQADNNLAEVYMMGKRYEVSAETIPVEMVMEVAAATSAGAAAELGLQGDDELDTPIAAIPDVKLTPEAATRIAERCEEVGFFLLLEPDLDPYRNFDDDDETDDSLGSSLTPTEVLSHSLAASLRFSQHKVLMACAEGLRIFATGEDPQ
jgi:SET domain